MLLWAVLHASLTSTSHVCYGLTDCILYAIALLRVWQLLRTAVSLHQTVLTRMCKRASMSLTRESSAFLAWLQHSKAPDI